MALREDVADRRHGALLVGLSPALARSWPPNSVWMTRSMWPAMPAFDPISCR
jgi:hypothetical protein